MTRARVVRFHRTGGPDVLQIEDVDVRAPGPGEALVRARALGLNRAEQMFRAGAYVVEPTYPATIGYEIAGEVVAIGGGVTNVEIGDHVSLLPVSPMTEYAVHGELAIAPAALLVEHPTNLSWESAAAAWMQFLTAYGALIEVAAVRPGDAVVVTAASSSVGLAAIQLANQAGATTIALTRTHAKRQRLLDAGAAYVIATDEDDLVARIHDITDGAGARVIFDAVGGPLFPRLAEAATNAGIILVYGALAPEVTPLPILQMLHKHLTVRGYDVFEFFTMTDRFAAGLADLMAGLADGSLVPIIDRVFAFDDFVAAHRHLESNEQFGKIVVSVP